MADIDINKLATLSGLTLSEAEAAQVKGRLQKLLNIMESLKELDLKDVEPMVVTHAKCCHFAIPRVI
jgi:aspartyl-tRNA(Asn)/glutamyl-tRNA(Gln) amidotransferase subunit C